MRRSFCDRFETILKIIKNIRKLKSDQKIGNKLIDVGHIYLEGDEIDLWMTLESIKDITRLSKCKSILIVYFDKVDIENGLIFYYNGDKDQTYLSLEIPNIILDDIGTSKSQKLFDLINTGEFIVYEQTQNLPEVRNTWV